MSEEKLPQSHDRIFRHAMSLPLVAMQFLKTWMPAAFLPLVDWSSLHVEKISGIDVSLAERREDVLQKIRVAGHPVSFYILFEHQTSPARIMPRRVMEYIGLVQQGYRGEIEAGGMLPLVIPVVIFPGPGKWTAVRRLRDLIEIPAEIAEWASAFVPDCGFVLVELSGVQWEKLADGCLARAVMGALQSERTGEMKFQAVRRIVGELFAEPQREEAQKLANHLWRYLLHHSELQSREVCEIVESTIPAEQKEDFMSTADILRQEGEMKGELRAQQQAVVEALEIRFDLVPDGLREEIEHITDSTRLHLLHRVAIRCTDLESFTKEIQRANVKNFNPRQHSNEAAGDFIVPGRSGHAFFQHPPIHALSIASFAHLGEELRAGSPGALAMSADYPHIQSVYLTRWERPRLATVWTKYGIVCIVWKDVAGNRCWFASGTGDADREAVPAIEHIEQMCEFRR